MKKIVISSLMASLIVASGAARADGPNTSSVSGVGAGVAVAVQTRGEDHGKVDGGPVALVHASGAGADNDGTWGTGALGKAEFSIGGHPSIDIRTPSDGTILRADPAFGTGNLEAGLTVAAGWTPLEGCGLVGEATARLRVEGSTIRPPRVGGFEGEVGAGIGCLRKDFMLVAAPFIGATMNADSVALGGRVLLAAGPVAAELSAEWTGYKDSENQMLIDRRLGASVRLEPTPKTFIGAEVRYADVANDPSRTGGVETQAVGGFAF